MRTTLNIDHPKLATVKPKTEMMLRAFYGLNLTLIDINATTSHRTIPYRCVF